MDTQPQPTATYWHCDECAHSGHVVHDLHAGVWEVFMAISNDHHRVDRLCQGGGDDIRVSKQPLTQERLP